jgi:heme o synthase
MNNSSTSLSLSQFISAKMKAYAILAKVRLSSFVILSSVIGFIYASLGLEINWVKLVLFTIGGSLVTFASNAINQVIERESDKLMTRTMHRPLPLGHISQLEAILFIGITAIMGISILAFSNNLLTGVLAALSLLIYGFVYTPLKKVSSIAVFVGAIPGALPPLLGYVAVQNQIDNYAIWLFLIQFFWQFPHFWSIAWVSYEDYLKADIMLLPSKSGKSKQSAWITLIYTLVLIPLSFYPLYLGYPFSIGICLLVAASAGFSYLAFKLYQTLENIDAKKLMFGSFAYLLIFLISIFI